MPEYDDHINPPEETGSAISKSLGQMALTMGLFIGGQALAMMGFGAGKARLFKYLSKLPAGAPRGFTISAAAEHARSRGNSLTAFLSKVTKRDSFVGGISRFLDQASHDKTALKIQREWKDDAFTKLEKYRAYKALDKPTQSILKSQWASKYARETAFLFPTFYAMEQVVGHVTPGPEHKKRPAWYNLPGHAIEMAKFVPMYLAGDAVFRGLFKGIGAGVGYMAERVEKHMPEVVQTSMVRIADYMRKGNYLERKVGPHKLREYAAGLGAAKDAFVHAVGARSKAWLATQKTLSKYERSKASFRNARKNFSDTFIDKYDVYYKQRLDAYARRKAAAGKDTIEALESDFDDFIKFAKIGVSGTSSEYAEAIGRPTGMLNDIQTHLKTQFFKENRRTPFLARLMGLRRSKGADYKQKRTIGKLYEDMKKVKGGGKKPLGLDKKDFVDNIVSQNTFIHEGSKLLVDLAPMRPKYWLDKMAHSKLLVLGNKFSIADLFPFKVFSAKEMPRVLLMNDITALHPSSQTQGLRQYTQAGFEKGGVISHKNIHEFKAPGLVMRKAGEKSYKLYDYDPDSGAWDVIAKNVKPALLADSPKLANTFIRGQIRTADLEKTGAKTGAYSSNPLVGWVQKHLSLFDNAGEDPSLFSRLRLFLPDSVNKILSPADVTPYSKYRAKKTLQQLAEITKMDIKDVKKLGLTEQEEIQHLFMRVRSLGQKVSKKSFNEVLSQDVYMQDVVDFLAHNKIIKDIKGSDAVSSTDTLLDIAAQLFGKETKRPISIFGEDKAVQNILKAARIGNKGIEGRGGFGYGEEPLQKVKRYIYEYAVYHSEAQALPVNRDINSILRATMQKTSARSQLSKTEIANVEFGMFYDKLRYTLHAGSAYDKPSKEAVEAVASKYLKKEYNLLADDDITFILIAQNELLRRNPLLGKQNVLDEIISQTGQFETTWARNVNFEANDLLGTVGQVRGANPFVLYPGELGSQIGLGFGWAGATVNKLISFSGLGWDSGRFNNPTDVAKLWGKRAAAFAGASVAYGALDTFTDTSGLFDWTFLDEGITAGLADQAVKARLAAGWAYDKMGIDNASRYLEGMMPGFTKVAPGAAMGFMMGGVKGAVIGGLANAYLQPQLEEGPLGFLAAVPGANFFVTDPTLGFSEIQDIYEGQRMLPVRKGRGWCLTPDDRVQTKYGHYISADAVKVKDKLVGLDGKTHEVSQILTREIDESIVQLMPHHTYISPKLTKQHPVLTSPDTEELKWKEAEKVNKEDWLVYKKPSVNSHSKKLKLLHTGEFYTNYDLGLFLGWFMATGTIQHNGKYLIEATYDSKEQGWVDSIITYLKEVWKVRKVTIESPSPTGQTRRIRFSSVELWSVIKKLCYNDTKKYNNPVFLSFGKDFLKAFLVGWFYGDGHFTKNKEDCYINAAFTSATEQHILQLWNILLVFDIFGYLYKRNEGQSYRLLINAKQLQSFLDLGATKYYTEEDCKLQEHSFNLEDTFRIKKDKVFIKVKFAEQLHYAGLVYDYTVEDSHNFSLEQFIVHNSLGITPIAGGRISRYEPGWYPRLKSQYKASPTLYGSKLEQFLAKDVPFIDFSLMDIIDPHYLEYKHMKDRPYPMPSTPFAEVPVVGPALSATAGQLYNFIHPLGQVAPMQKERAMRQYMGGVSTNWRGESLATYGPQHGGFLGAYNNQNLLPGNTGSPTAVMSPHSIKPLIGEQVYKGWIEPLGLPGFITSAAMWGGDEPYTHIPVAESANNMDSLTRAYWEQNLGDLVGTTELLRRAIPRPRTSYDKFNPIKNDMPGWMSETFKTGDPYCILPDTLVETSEGLLPAKQVTEKMLLKTLHGQYYPVHKIATRPVAEEIYCIKIKGLEDIVLKTTGGHPFYINDQWKFAKDLTTQDRTSYPLFAINFSEELNLLDKNIKIDGQTSYILGLLSRWCLFSEDNKLEFREEIPSSIYQEIQRYLSEETTIAIVQYLQQTGIPAHFKTAPLFILLNYMKAFLVSTETTNKQIVFRFHTKDAAYNAWSALLQNQVIANLEGTTLTVVGRSANLLSFDLGLADVNTREEITFLIDNALEKTRTGPLALLEIDSIEKEYYEGLVYTIDMGEAGTYTLPGAAVHNSKIARGELLLPGDSYENFFNPEIDFPTGMSRLGYNPYEQAMSMIGLGSFTLKEEEILEEGTAIHTMVQNQLLSTGLATRVEALISAPEQNLRSFVDVMYRDPRTQQELPLEIKSINARGLAQLTMPKWKHKVQINSYMAAMGVSQGRFLYVSREDPSQTKEFQVRFDPSLWERTKTNLEEARKLATNYLEQGYGYAQEGYSYLDRMRVLLNASPYSKEFRDTSRLLEEQMQGGYLTPREEEEFSVLQSQHKHILRKYEMYPRRFQVSELLAPDEFYPEELSLNPNVLPASQYNLIERTMGSAWEYLTHLRSPVHTKLIGAYSPLEHYENMSIRGDFASWTTPIESFIKPWGRGLAAANDPLQGAVSFGTGGAILGGLPGAIAGTAIGAVYGTARGFFEAATSGSTLPKSFQEKVEIQDYFDKLEYTRALRMYRATQDKQYRTQMQKTQYGWLDYMQENQARLEEMQEVSPQTHVLRQTRSPIMQGIGADRGFGSPWQGSDSEFARIYNTAFYKGYSALPSWDRPFWSTFVETSDQEDQDDILRRTDTQMGEMLKAMWGRAEEIALPDMGSYFSRKTLPSALNPIMDPTVDMEDIQMLTVEDQGMNAHDFGLGWRDQLTKIRNSALNLQPLAINDQGYSSSIQTDMKGPEIRDALQKVLARMGYTEANVMVSSAPSMSAETQVDLNVKRTSARDIIDQYYG